MFFILAVIMSYFWIIFEELNNIGIISISFLYDQVYNPTILF